VLILSRVNRAIRIRRGEISVCPICGKDTDEGFSCDSCGVDYVGPSPR
jgi:hypothetical protein